MDQPDKPRFGDYILLTELGRGTTGIVYKAQHCCSSSLIALKTIQPVAGVDRSQQVARLYREAQVLANFATISEPNTPRVYQAGEWEGHSYYCREYIDGQTLEKAIKNGAINRRKA